MNNIETEENLEYDLIDIQWDTTYSFDESPVRTVRDDTEIFPKDKSQDIVPKESTQDAVNIRRQIIRDFWKELKDLQPDAKDRKVHNLALDEDIYLVYRTYEEAHTHSAKSYESTEAFLRLEEVLMNARPVTRVSVKPNDSNQKDYLYMLIMTYEYEDLGRLKITVGIRRKQDAEGTHLKDAYAITALQEDQKLAEKPKVDKKRKKHLKK